MRGAAGRRACRQVVQACTCTRHLATVVPKTPIPPQVVKRLKREEDRTPSLAELSLLHSASNAPAKSALYAFANRLALPYADDIALIEQTLIHPSFWKAVIELTQHDERRLRFTHFHDDAKASNQALETLGNALLGAMGLEKVMQEFPRLPIRTLKDALTLYVGPKSLSLVAKSWGIAPTYLERKAIGVEKEKLSRKEAAYGHLVEGRGGARKSEIPSGTSSAVEKGLLRWDRRKDQGENEAILYEDALASTVRATVGAIYQTSNFAATREFVHKHLLPVSWTHIVPLLKFRDPHSLLKIIVPDNRRVLLAESGRLTSQATFLSGSFGDAQDGKEEVQLGEGFGSSIKMANFRAAEDALRRFYLSSRRDPWRYDPENDTKPLRDGLPSDTWTEKEFGGWIDVLDHEETYQSSSHAGRGH